MSAQYAGIQANFEAYTYGTANNGFLRLNFGQQIQILRNLSQYSVVLCDFQIQDVLVAKTEKKPLYYVLYNILMIFICVFYKCVQCAYVPTHVRTSGQRKLQVSSTLSLRKGLSDQACWYRSSRDLVSPGMHWHSKCTLPPPALLCGLWRMSTGPHVCHPSASLTELSAALGLMMFQSLRSTPTSLHAERVATKIKSPELRAEAIF